MSDRVQRWEPVLYKGFSGVRVDMEYCANGNWINRNDLEALHASIIDQGRKALNATSEIGMSHAEYIEWVMERLEGK